MKAHLVGGGLASFAAAAYLIRDGRFLANNIYIYEASEGLGGCLRMAGGPATGYILPTGRIFEKEYPCALDLFSLVPSASDPEKSIKDEIFEFNERYGYYDKAHIIDCNGDIIKGRHFGLSVRDRLDFIKLALTPEGMLDDKRIEEFFSDEFFQTEFWYLWTTLMFSLPQHGAMEMRRFMHRFLHLLPDFSEMTKIYRTRYNQYEAIAAPILDWLRRQGVNFLTHTNVTNVGFSPSLEEVRANSLEYVRGGDTAVIEVGVDDLVMVTNGSQIADLSVGSMTSPASPHSTGRSWALWKRLARGRPEFGNPDAFFGEDRVGDAKWLSFTVTTTDPTYFEQMTELTGSEPGRGGLLTLKDSNWLLTVAIFHQPEFLDQPPDVMVWWGYAIYPDKEGNYVKKPMSGCSGAEILEEVLRHLRFEENLTTIVGSSICIPCTLPYAHSVWLARKQADRPKVVPDGSTNFAFIGQFAELPLDANYTMEYSVRSAREAVSTLLNIDNKPPPVYQGWQDAEVLYRAIKALA
jgi:oleate hydratase